MLRLLAIFIKLSPRCPDGVGSRLKLVRHVAGHCPLGPTLLIRLLTLLLLPLLLNNLWQTVWGTPPLSTFSLLSYIAGVFKSSIIPYQLLLVATGNPDYQSEMIRDKFDLIVTVATTRQRAECCLDMCFHRKDLLASGSVEWCLHGSKRRDLKCPQEKCGGDAGWTLDGRHLMFKSARSCCSSLHCFSHQWRWLRCLMRFNFTNLSNSIWKSWQKKKHICWCFKVWYLI